MRIKITNTCIILKKRKYSCEDAKEFQLDVGKILTGKIHNDQKHNCIDFEQKSFVMCGISNGWFTILD